MVEQNVKTATVEAPLGTYAARVDDKGRLKLPVDIQRYLGQVFLVEGGEEKIFITTLDVRIARIYPISLWKQNETLLEQEVDDPEAAEDIAFLAKDLGGTSEIDSQGRVLVPAELRRELTLENQPVWLDCYRGRINIYGQAVYEERRARSRMNPEDKARRFEKKGLK